MDQGTISTSRLTLRSWRPEDESAMVEINRDPEVTRYLNRPVDPEAVAAFYGICVAHWEEHGFGYYAVEDRRRRPRQPGRTRSVGSVSPS